MIVNLLVGLAVGLLVPRAERVLKSWAESLWIGQLPISDHEFDLAALLLMLIAASILVAILGVASSAFLLCLGAFFGLFGHRLWALIAMKETL